MGSSFAGLILGAIIGGIAGAAASARSPNDWSYYSRNILCLVNGAGLGAIAGAIVGGTAAIIDELKRGRKLNN